MKFNRILTAGLSAVILVALPLAAQRPGHGGDLSQMLLRFSTVLDLTESQKTAATTIFDAAKKQAEPLATALKASHESIEAAITTNKSDREIDDLTAKQGTLMGQIGSIQAKARRSFLALLTPEQREKLDKLRAERPQGRPRGPRL